MKHLLAFRGLAHDAQGILAAVHRLAGVCVELLRNIQLPSWSHSAAGSLEGFIAAHTRAQQSTLRVVLNNPQLALRHGFSLAHLARGA